jgi:phosphate transport system permease protein
MSVSVLIAAVLLIMAIGYQMGRKRALKSVGGLSSMRNLHSLPSYYGSYVLLWAALPSALILLIWGIIQDSVLTQIMQSHLPAEMLSLSSDRLGLLISSIKSYALTGFSASEVTPQIQAAADEFNRLSSTAAVAQAVLVLIVATIAAGFAWRAINPKMRARNRVEKIVRGLLILSSLIAILTTVGIIFSVLFESIRFFQRIPFFDFVFGLQWSPQTAIRADQVASDGLFGAIPLFAGTILITLIAMLVAVPIGLMSAIYLAEYASPKLRSYAKPVIEILAGIPTVVYGFFAMITVAPAIREFGQSVGLDVSSESALAVGLVMGVMIIPFVSSLSDDVINAVPQSLRDASFGVGATHSETIKQVILPAALPGIMGGVLLAVSRAIGETMIVVMAAGVSANLTANPLDAVTTVTVQIVTLLTGDQEFDSSKTLAAFALGMMLFVVTLALNVIALKIVRKYREQYD